MYGPSEMGWLEVDVVDGDVARPLIVTFSGQCENYPETTKSPNSMTRKGILLCADRNSTH